MPGDLRKDLKQDEPPARTYEPHELAKLFPPMEGPAFDELVADIKANGLADPIDLLQGQILDGRNRFRAAVAAGVALERRNFRTFIPELYGDPLKYVLSKNLHRRHLDESQRALVASRIATLPVGRPEVVNAQNCAITQEAAGRMLNVSRRLVQSAAAVGQDGAPELVKAVERGKLSISAAAIAVRLDREQQVKVAARAETGDQNATRTLIKQMRRADNERLVGEKILALPQKKFGVILADPEWRFAPWSRETGLDRAADNHYATSPTEVIASRDVASIAADDCVLFLWATGPMNEAAFVVMKAWGFEYKAQCVWNKERIGRQHGTGYWFWGEHELLLVGTRGKVQAPAPGLQWVSSFYAPVGRHSEKPEVSYQMIEAYFPTLPKIELNRRGTPRPGWEAWGAEAKEEVTHHETTQSRVTA